MDSLELDGHMTIAKQPAFQVGISSDINNIAVTTAHTSMSFDLEHFDRGDDFDLGNNRFVAPVTGLYQFNLHFYVQSVDADSQQIDARIVTSNRTYVAQGGKGKDVDSTLLLNIGVLADMDAGDTAHVDYRSIGGSAQADVVTQTFWSGYLVC